MMMMIITLKFAAIADIRTQIHLGNVTYRFIYMNFLIRSRIQIKFNT